LLTLQLPSNWRPRPYQRPAWDYLERGGKRCVLVCHRRWGKDDLALHRTAVAAHERVGTYWHMLPEYEQGRKAIWNAINAHTGKRRIDEAFPPELRKRTVDDDMLIEFKNGSVWQVVGSDRYDSLVGAGIAGVIFSEWSLANPAAWAFISPMLEENNGWALFIYTARGRNHGWSMYERANEDEGWFGLRQTALETGVFKPEALEAAKKDYQALYGLDDGQALFDQEYMCSFDAAIIGAFYGKELRNAELEGRIGNVPHERGKQVITAWDLGFSDSTAIWFCQQVGRELHFIDYYEANNQGLDHYAKVLRDKGYLYSQHLLPHDIEHYELGTGKSRAATLLDLGVRPTTVQMHQVLDGVNAVRMILDRCWFDKVKCARGIEALRSYRRDYDDKRKVYKPAPLHDWASHGADAFRYFASGFRDSPIKSRPIDRYRSYEDAEASSPWTV
jgi:phage terminase large subunit